MSKFVVSIPGLMSGFAKGSAELKVTEPPAKRDVRSEGDRRSKRDIREVGDTTADSRVRKLPVGGWGIAAEATNASCEPMISENYHTQYIGFRLAKKMVSVCPYLGPADGSGIPLKIGELTGNLRKPSVLPGQSANSPCFVEIHSPTKPLDRVVFLRTLSHVPLLDTEKYTGTNGWSGRF